MCSPTCNLQNIYHLLYRHKRSELSAGKSQLVENGPALTSTPFARQSSLQQELQAQEVNEWTCNILRVELHV